MLRFGCARLFGSFEFRSQAKIIESALRADVTHFDTASMYGAENVIGQVLQGQVILSSLQK